MPPYSSFSKPQRRRLRLLLGFAAITSPLTATIYFPLLPLLRDHFHTSTQAINLTLTIYIVFQAVSPLIFGPLSDLYGRRPLFLLTLALYAAANIGLAANTASQGSSGSRGSGGYAVLLVLRAVQSLGASAAYAIAFGVVADVAPPAERGAMLGPIGMALNLGACVGPVVGGALAYHGSEGGGSGYVWVFWALVVVAAVLLVAVALFIPETARPLVGNGGDPSRYRWWQRSGADLVCGGGLFSKASKGKEKINVDTLSGCQKTQPQTRSFAREPSSSSGDANNNNGVSSQPSPPPPPSFPARPAVTLARLLLPFRIMFYRDTALALWLHGSYYAVDYAFVAAVPDIFQSIYDFNNLQLGLAYLPRGIGIIASSYLVGWWMDRSYRWEEAQSTSTDTATTTTAPPPFLERARTRGTVTQLAIATATIVAYGWAVQRRAHPAVPLILQLAEGMWNNYFYTTFATLLVDSFPPSPASASAATSVIRCAMAAVAVAVQQPVVRQIGRAWFFTLLGLWSGLSGAAAVGLLRCKGRAWREARTKAASPREATLDIPADQKGVNENINPA